MWFAHDIPQAKVHQDLSYYIRIFNEGDDSHFAETFWADEGVNFINFLY